MAGNIFAQNPLSVALDEGRKRREMTMQERGIGPQADQAPAPSFDGISSQYQVPVNILMSMSEASGLQGNDALSFADQQARLIAPRLQAGASVTGALTSIYGNKVPPDAMTAMLDRAKAIGDKLYPVQADPNADPNADPFAGEGAGALAARRGQQFAAGATDVAASIPEGLALSSRNVMEQKDKIVSLQASRLSDERDALNATIQANGPENERGRSAANRLKVVEFMLGRYDDNTQINEEIWSTPVGETAVFQLGQDLRNASERLFGAPDKRDTGLWGQVANGAGNMAGFIAASMLGGVVGGSAGALAAGGATGSALTGSQLYKEAIAAGADEATAMEAARWGSLIGASEILPIAHTLKLLPASVRSKILSGISGRVADIVRRGANIAGGAVEEGVQEYLSQVAQNITAQQLYDKDRGWTDGAGEAALVGAILGGGMGVPGAIRSTPPKDDGGGDQGGDNAAPDSSGGFTGLRLTPDQRTDVGMILRPDQRVDGTAAVPAPTGPLGRAAEAGPAPLSTAFDTGQMVNITTSDGMDMNAQFVQETPSGILVIDPADGSQFEIPREEIDSGVTRIGQVVEQSVPEAPMSAAEATPDAVPAEPAPTPENRAAATSPMPQADTGPVTMQQEVLPPQVASKPENIEEMTDNQLGEITSLIMDSPAYTQTDAQMRLVLSPEEIQMYRGAGVVISDIGIIERDSANAMLDERARRNAPKPKPESKPETKRDGTPFASEAAARQALKNRRLDPLAFDVVPKGDGFVAVSNPTRSPSQAEVELASGFKPKKKPLLNMLKSVGVHPQSPLADELRNADITPKTAPGLFRWDGATAWDNLPTTEWGDIAPMIGEDGNGYLSEQGLKDALIGEFSGTPMMSLNDAALAEEESYRAQNDVLDGATDAVDAPDAQSEPTMLDQNSDFNDQGTRRTLAEILVQDYRESLRDGDWISDGIAKRATAILSERGGYVEDAVYDAEIELEQENAKQPDTGIPFPDLRSALPEAGSAETSNSQDAGRQDDKPSPQGVSGGVDASPASTRTDAGEIPQGLHAATDEQGARTGSLEGGSVDLTPEGQQTVIPGAEKITDKKLAERKMDAPKRGGNAAPDEGGLFGPNGGSLAPDLFDAAPEKAAPAETKRDGSPFATEAAAKQALKNRRLKPEDFEIIPRDGGFVAVARAGEAAPVPKAAQPDIKAVPISETPPVSETTEPTTAKEVEQAAAEADPAPTDAQKEAGNYKLGHVTIQGLDVSIENAKGSERSGKDADGESWSVTMPAHYGYVKKTTGADGDAVDVYIGDNPESDVVVVVDQLDLATGKFDEHKVILGAKNAAEARTIYEGGFSDGKGAERIGGGTEMTVDGFKEWLANGDQTKPAASPKAQGKAIFDRLEASQTRENAENAAVEALGKDTPAAKPLLTNSERGSIIQQFEKHLPTDARVLFKKMIERAESDAEYQRRFDEYLTKPSTSKIRDLSDPFGGYSKLKVSNAVDGIDDASIRVGEANRAGKKLGSNDQNPMTPRMKGKQDAALDREYQAGFTYRKWIDGGNVSHAEAATVAKVEYNRRKFNRMDADQQAAYEKKLKETKTEYRLWNKSDPDTYKPVPKLVYEYYAESQGQPSQDEKPATTEKPKPNSANPSTNSEKIEDFGEVLKGAAKHYAAAYGEKMKVAGEQDTKEVPLSKSWPVPDYQKLIDEGADPWAVSFARAARDEVPSKPRGRYAGGRLSNWVKQVETLRKFSEDVMSGKMSKDKVAHGLMVGGHGLQGVGNRVDLYVAVGHEKSLAGVTLNEANYGVYDGVEHNPPLVMWTVSRAAKATAFGNMPYQLAKGATKEEAIAAFKKNISKIETQPKASKQVRFAVYSYRHRKGFIVGKKIGRQHVDLATFDTKEEARKYLAENEDELVKKLEAFKSIPNERKESNSPRIGEDHRGGVDATAEMFAEAFGFRGVQFGNYVEGAKRQADLNRAYDALMDMAGVLDIPAKAISLNGTLGLAFGARGKGGKGAAAAHFEPDTIVINLTKKEGAGSLAHEWWHAADNYFSRIRKQPSGYFSETPYKTKGRDTDAELRQEIADAFKAVRDAIGKTDMAKRSAELDKRRTKGYWATGRELSARAFEGFIISKLADNGLANDYLANITSEGVWNAEEALSGHEDAKSYPYPTEGEQKAITEAYDALFRAVETKETPTGVAMLSRGEPVTALTGKEFGKDLNIRQLQKAARDWYRENLSGTHVTMEQTGWDIQFTNASAKKTTFTHHAELLRVIPALKEILAKGRVVATEDYKGTKKDFRAVHKISATVEVDGKPRDVIVIVREHKNGHFQYALSRDNSVGARFSKSIANHPERVGGKSKAPDGILDHADTINLYLDDGNIKEELAELPDKPYRLITNPRFQAKVDEVKIALIEQLQKIGIANKIKVEVAENIMAMTPSGVTVRANGFHFGNTIGIALSGSQMTKDVMNHEAIHALRSPDLWGGKEYGLFTKAEWQALVAHARKDKARMAKVRRVYSDLNTAGQIEEAIADIYAEWADANIQHPTKIEQILQKMQDFFEAIGNALRGNGFRSANDVFRSISEGEVGARQDLVEGGDVPSRGIKLSKEEMDEITPETEAQSNARYSKALDGAVGSIKGAGPATWKRAMQIARGIKHGDTLTQLMSGDKSSILGFVPGRNLFTELGKAMPSAQKYIGIKQEMDAVRSEWHAKTDEVAKKWRKVMWKQSKANKRMMDLMHQSTLAQVDPSKAFETTLTDRDKAVLKAGVGKHKAAYEAAEEKRLIDEQRKIDHGTLVVEFDRLPAGFRRMFAEVRDTYEAMDKEFDKALIENIEKAMEVTVRGHERRHKAEIERISDEGLTGAERAEAVAKADKTLATSKAKARWGNRARVIAMRQKFESNRLVGPYFPLGRFGSFAVTVRDAKTGKVKNFSRFEKASEQTEFAATMRKDKTNKVEVGIIEEQNLKEQVDANFVADIEQILGDAKVDKDVMDSVWQKWLQDYVPELSLRKTNIHRKGIPGYSNDAFRVFGRHVMHGAHQLARLKYGLDLGQALENAAPEARRADDPVRAGLVLEEMRRRHKFTMNPTGAAWATTASSFAFTWYLAMTPAAALVNISQTTVIGIPVLAAYHDGKGGTKAAAAAYEISKASKDFVKGYGTADRGKNLSKDESAAMKEAYRRSTIDATNAHDIAGVAESGVEYSDRRMRIMGALSFLFHHAERFNREVTFLAAYRMARKKGRTHEEAIDVGSDLTWKTHFDYQNTSRPRVMQGDVAKVVLTFRNYQANMIWRLFRDTHQVFKGKSKADKKEALRQLGGMTAMMALHAGVRGTWLFGITMMIAGLFFDEPEEDLKKGAVDLLGNTGASLLLNGIIGTATGTAVSERMGMPDLLFRSSGRDLDGRDEYNYWLTQSLGASFGLVERAFRGVNMMIDGKVWRGIETLAPKFVRDQMKAQRFYEEGALTYRGDPLMEEVDFWDQLKQGLGFTPAALAERYQTNNWMENREKGIRDERSALQTEAGRVIMDGGSLSSELVDNISAFNQENPSYPITRKTLKASIRGRQRASANNEYGTTIIKSLNDVIRREAAPLISQ